jgi:hypothetical protein
VTLRARLVFDLALFCALLVAYNPAWTGFAVHEWLCVVAIVPLLFHVIVNWDQTMRIARRFADHVRHLPRLNLVVDCALFVAAVGAMLSGLMVSRAVAGALGIVTTRSVLWTSVHSFTADATIAVVLFHFALHWKWIVRVARSLALAPGSRITHVTSASPRTR